MGTNGFFFFGLCEKPVVEEKPIRKGEKVERSFVALCKGSPGTFKGPGGWKCWLCVMA